MENIAQRIIGTWRLVHSVSINPEGKKEYLYGEDAVGYNVRLRINAACVNLG